MVSRVSCDADSSVGLDCARILRRLEFCEELLQKHSTCLAELLSANVFPTAHEGARTACTQTGLPPCLYVHRASGDTPAGDVDRPVTPMDTLFAAALGAVEGVWKPFVEEATVEQELDDPVGYLVYKPPEPADEPVSPSVVVSHALSGTSCVARDVCDVGERSGDGECLDGLPPGTPVATLRKPACRTSSTFRASQRSVHLRINSERESDFCSFVYESEGDEPAPLSQKSIRLLDYTPMATQRVKSRLAILSDLRAKVRGELFDTHPAVKVVFDRASTVQLAQSVWDVTLFVFYQPLGHSTNWRIVVPFVFTVILQVSFLYGIVAFIVTVNETPAMMQDDFAEWRRVANFDVVVALCSGDASLASSYKQASTYETYVAYTEKPFDLGQPVFSAGPFLSFLVCTVWILTILGELGNIFDKILSVWQATVFSTRAIDLEIFQTSVSSGFHMVSLPLHRTLWFFVVCFIQVVITVLLLIAGLEWLVATPDIADLLLNGVTISFIFNLDELIFDVFIPVKIATVMSLLEPLPVKWPSCCPLRGLVLTVVGMLAAGGTLFLINKHFMEGVILRDTLCP